MVHQPPCCSTALTSRRIAARPEEKEVQSPGDWRQPWRTQTKIHALSDGLGRPLAFVLTDGQAADCRAAESLLHRLAPATLVMADQAYDTSAIRRQIEDQGAVPNIPPKRTRLWKSCFSPVLYRYRGAIERMFCRLQDYRRIANRYDKLAANFLSAVYLAAGVSY